jgi:glycerol-3-phosphate dehydrogenase
MSGFTNRNQLLEKMRNGENLAWDIIVVGGGITGAGILREAQRRGYRTLLIEQKDFSWGTSSRSSKMVHGGLRYLAAGDVKLTRESVEERQRLLDEAPGLINPISFYFTFRKGLFPGRLAMKVILTIYDFFAGIQDNRYCSNNELLTRFKGLQQTKLQGASCYTDAMVDDSRLVLRVLQESIDDGGHALNYTKVKDLLLEDDEVCGVRIEDSDQSKCLELTAPVVINATGAWADRLRNIVNKEKRIRPLRGSHIIIPKSLYPVTDVMTFLHQDDKRGVYIYPWEGTTVIGTTDLDHHEDLDIEASISDEETKYLLDGFNGQFPSNALTQDHILSTWAGVRPVIGAENSKNPSKERRDHAVWTDKGLVTVSGGKLTTFRLIALDALAAAESKLPSPKEFVDDSMFPTPNVSSDSLLPENTSLAQRLLGRYGEKAKILLENSTANERLTIEETEFSLAECRWAIRNEAVKHLDDLLLRRTRLGMCLPNGGDSLFPALKALFFSERNWDDELWQKELDRYKAIWQRHYSLPQKS